MSNIKKVKGNANASPSNSVKNQVQVNKNKGTIGIDELKKDFEKLTKNKKSTVKELLELAKIDPYKQIIQPPSVLFIDDVSYGTLGNFSCLTGKAKSGKTFFLSLLIAAVLDTNGKFQRLKTKVPTAKVLHFDTEQSEYHTQKVANRIIKLIDDTKNTQNYECYYLRKHPPTERIELIEEAIYNTKNLKLVVIDGIADLIVGYNNEEEAIKIINRFMKWTDELNIHIITVIHQNKGDKNAKGHLGSLILQKSETVLSVIKEIDRSTVEATESRGIDIQPISFSIDEKGQPYFVDYVKTTINKTKKSPFDFDHENHKTILKEVFKNRNEITSKEFTNQLKYVLGFHNIDIGYTAIRGWITYYKEQNFISKDNQQSPFKLSIS